MTQIIAYHGKGPIKAQEMHLFDSEKLEERRKLFLLIDQPVGKNGRVLVDYFPFLAEGFQHQLVNGKEFICF